MRTLSSSGVSPSSSPPDVLHADQAQQRVRGAVEDDDEGVEDPGEEMQRPGHDDGDALRLLDGVDLRDLLADRDVQRRREQVREHERYGEGDVVRDALAERVLEQRRHGRLAEEADAQRGEGDAELAGRQVARQVVRDADGERGGAAARLGLLHQIGAPRADVGELRGHEEPVEQHEHQDREEQQRAGHALCRLRRGGAPLLREASSSFIRRLRRG
jgi:hypothetical protein